MVEIDKNSIKTETFKISLTTNMKIILFHFRDELIRLKLEENLN
jgi:hypothetical protein